MDNTFLSREDFNEKYADPFDPTTLDNPNYILADGLYMSYDMGKTERNRNILLIGSSGSGKTEHVKNNILLGNTSMAVNDPSGYLINSCKSTLEQKEIKVQIFSAIDPNNSAHYNPFDYVQENDGKLNEEMLESIVQILCKYVMGDDHDYEFYWKYCKSLIKAIICACIEMNAEGKTKICFSDMWKLVKGSRSDFEKILANICEKDSRSLANNIYNEFGKAAPDTKEYIWNSVRMFFHQFAIRPLKDVMTPDTENPQNNIQLERLQQEKTILFIKSGTWTKSNDFIYDILYFQLFYVLIGHSAVDNIRERVHIYFDEMGNMAPVPNLYMFLAVCRKYDVGCTMSFQSAEQIKYVYGGDWEAVAGNCDTMIYLCGGATIDTSKYVSRRLGDTTISPTPATKNFVSKIIGGRWVKADPTTALPRYRPKISPDEITELDRDRCIVQVRSENPVIALKIGATERL